MSAYDSYGSDLDSTPRVRKVSGPFGTEALKTVAEALAFCEREGLDPSQVSLAHNYVIWEAEKTPEQVALRIERAEAGRQRHLDFVRDNYRAYAERGLFDATRAEADS